MSDRLQERKGYRTTTLITDIDIEISYPLFAALSSNAVDISIEGFWLDKDLLSRFEYNLPGRNNKSWC